MSCLLFVRHHCLHDASLIPLIGQPSQVSVPAGLEQHHDRLVFFSFQTCGNYNKVSVLAAIGLGFIAEACEQER